MKERIVIAEGWLIGTTVRIMPMGRLRNIFFPLKKEEINFRLYPTVKKLLFGLQGKKVRLIVEEVEEHA